MRRRILLGLAILLGTAIIAGVASTSWLSSFGARPTGARLERIRRSPHFAEGKFRNSVPTNKLAPGSFLAMLRHQLFGDEERVPKRSIPVIMHAAFDYAAAPASGRAASRLAALSRRGLAR